MLNWEGGTRVLAEMLEVPLRAEFHGEGARGGDGVGRVGRGVDLVL
jgi:hypothetical protein